MNRGRSNLKEQHYVCTYIVVSALTQCGVVSSGACAHSCRTVRTVAPSWDPYLTNCKDGFLSAIAQNQWYQMRTACLCCGGLEMGRWLERPGLVLLYTEQNSLLFFSPFPGSSYKVSVCLTAHLW